MRPLLAISGKRCVGKDTFAALLGQAARARGVELATYAFAAESKQLFVEARRAAGVEVDLARLSADRAYKEAWRPALTAFTVAALAADPLVFVRRVAGHLDGDPRPAVITDLRLGLELDYLRPRFALVVVRLVRADRARAASGWVFDPAKDLHHTETELDDPARWDETVVNDGTEAELGARAAAVLTRLLPGSAAPRSDR